MLGVNPFSLGMPIGSSWITWFPWGIAQWNPKPRYNHRQGCSIQYLGDKKSHQLGLWCQAPNTGVSWCLQINGFWRDFIRYPSLWPNLLCLSCRASGSQYSKPPLAWGLTTENWFFSKKRLLWFHPCSSMHSMMMKRKMLWIYDSGTKVSLCNRSYMFLAYGPSVRSSAQSWRSLPIEWCRCPTNQFRPALNVTVTQGET